MEDAPPQLRSVAAELAVLFLRELEPRVADDPELLVSTEAVLSFAAIRHADAAQVGALALDSRKVREV